MGGAPGSTANVRRYHVLAPSTSALIAMFPRCTGVITPGDETIATELGFGGISKYVASTDHVATAVASYPNTVHGGVVAAFHAVTVHEISLPRG